MDERKFLTALQAYALIFGAGGVAALQAMKWELFSFPDEVKLYLGYFFSIVTVICVFLAGPGLMKMIKETRADIDHLKEIKKLPLFF